MSAFTIVSKLSADSAPSGAAKRVTFTVTGTASNCRLRKIAMFCWCALSPAPIASFDIVAALPVMSPARAFTCASPCIPSNPLAPFSERGPRMPIGM